MRRQRACCIGNGVTRRWSWKAHVRAYRKREREWQGWRVARVAKRDRLVTLANVPRVARQLRIAPRGVALFMAAIDHRPASRIAANTPLIAI